MSADPFESLSHVVMITKEGLPTYALYMAYETIIIMLYMVCTPGIQSCATFLTMHGS